MIRKLLTLLIMTGLVANQAIASFSHCHGESSEQSAKPHIHLGAHGHSHDHGHHHHDHHHDGHQHHDDHQHQDSSERYCPSPIPVGHDGDAFYLTLGDVVLPEPCEIEAEGFLVVLKFPLESWAKPTPRANDANLVNPNRPVALAHAPILKKIRLLL